MTSESKENQPRKIKERKPSRDENNEDGDEPLLDTRRNERTAPSTVSGPFSHFRKNLALLDEARDNLQFNLGPRGVVAEDVDVHNVFTESTRLRTDWGDGSGGDCDPIQAADVELNLKSQRHYAESASGKFKKYKESKLSLRPSAAGNGRGATESDHDRYLQSVRTVASVEAAVWLLAQGLTTGFALAPLVIQKNAISDAQFIVSYARYATSFRRIMYVMSLVSAFGALDHLLKTLRNPVVSAHRQRQF
jgi:hypothetical protein